MCTYSFTFKKQSHPRFISYLDTHMVDIQNLYPDAFWTVYYEEDKKGIIHCHGICQSKKRIYIHDIHAGPGWTVDWRLTECEAAWRTYITKQKGNENRIINKHIQIEEDFHKVQRERDSVSLADIVILNDGDYPRHWKNIRIV